MYLSCIHWSCIFWPPRRNNYCSALLTLSFPEDMAAAACNDVADHRAVFEKFEFRSIRDVVTGLISSACISIGRNFVVFGGERRSGVGVGFGIMGVRELEECF